MKQEDLKALNLTEEQLKEIQRLNGLDIKNLQEQLAVKEAEIKDIESKLAKFEGIDPEAIKAEADQYKTDVAAKEAEIKQLQKAYALDMELIKKGCRNTKAAKAIIPADKLENADEATIHALVEGLTESDGYLFAAKEGVPQVASSVSTKKEQITKDEFRKMKYRERLAIYKEDPELYKSLTE
ncbi:MAG: phage scaffolding protein [Tissierellia bacterium]|nr:phage scaffolding protein [Tissierellia bacterium]